MQNIPPFEHYGVIPRVFIFASQGFLVYFAPDMWSVKWNENPWLAKMPFLMIMFLTTELLYVLNSKTD